MTSVDVYVSVGPDDVRAGRLYSHRRRGTESASFTYDERYLASSTAYALDPELPLFSGTHQTPVGVPIFRAFADSSPDRWGRNLITRSERLRARTGRTAAHSFGEYDLLLQVRDDLRQGATRFRDTAGSYLADEDHGVPALTDLPTLLSAAAEVVTDTEDADALALLLHAGSSLGGARPKAHVRDTSGRLAIAKFPSPADDWNVMAWEKTALDLAALAGITVPANELITVGGRNALIVDRFDRTAAGSRIGYASAMTMLEARDGDVRSYLDIAEVIEERSPAATTELRQLWRRIAFTILVSNTDDHLRNHAFLHASGDAWRLSPAFDINPNPAPGPKVLSTAIDNSTTSADLRTLLAVADLFRLRHPEAITLLGEVNRAVRQWRDVAGRHGLSKRAVAAMAPAFDHHQTELAAKLTR